MPRQGVPDGPDAWHHVINRGIDKRCVFERRSDFRFFMSQMARAVRRKEIEIHAFCLMTTHFHILLKSERGKLAMAMQRIENSYARHFIRERNGGGSVFRGRYRSKPVQSETYRRLLIRYIHFNPVKAGVVEKPGDYRYSSARLLRRQRRPGWLADYWLQADERGMAEASARGARSRRACERELSMAEDDLVERRIEWESTAVDPLDQLLAADSARLLSWLRQRALKANKKRPHTPILGERLVTGYFHEFRAKAVPWELRLRSRIWDAAMIAQVYMLRDLSGLSFVKIGHRLGITQSTARRRFSDHRLAMADGAYAAKFTSLVQSMLKRGFGETGPGLDRSAGEGGPGAVLSQA